MRILKEIFKAFILSMLISFLICGITLEALGESIEFNVFEEEISKEKNIGQIEEIFEPKKPEPIVIVEPKKSENYATLKIQTANIELPIYYGKTKNLLKLGVGQDDEAYLPGEGGSVILMGHNFNKFLGRLPKAEIGDLIEITTNYGEFSYTIYDTQIIKETEVDKVPIQKDEEILMIYTCWPINNVTHAYERYVVYAK